MPSFRQVDYGAFELRAPRDVFPENKQILVKRKLKAVAPVVEVWDMAYGLERVLVPFVLLVYRLVGLPVQN